MNSHNPSTKATSVMPITSFTKGVRYKGVHCTMCLGSANNATTVKITHHTWLM